MHPAPVAPEGQIVMIASGLSQSRLPDPPSAPELLYCTEFAGPPGVPHHCRDEEQSFGWAALESFVIGRLLELLARGGKRDDDSDEERA